MAWWTRLFEFSGGILETNAYGDESDATPGVYLDRYRNRCSSKST